MAGNVTSSSTFANIGSGIGGVGTGFSGAVAGLEGLFGTSSTQKQDQTVRGTVTESLDITPEGVQKILQDILAGEQGLASIFGAENTAGIFNSSVSAQASGDLLTKLAGEIAKLTAKKTSETDSTTTTKQKTGSGGLLGQLF